MSKLRVVKQGAGLIVIGTDQVIEAREALPPGVTGWDHSERGLYARRQGRWRACAEPPYAPKDARPAVQFIAVRSSADPSDAERQRVYESMRCVDDELERQDHNEQEQR